MDNFGAIYGKSAVQMRLGTHMLLVHPSMTLFDFST